MQEPKGQHFIPEMLLCRFTDENGKLYCFRKDSPDKVFESTPKNAFKKRHLHTQFNEHGEKDFSVETELSKLEGQADEAIEKIIQAARLGRPPSLTSNEKKVWDNFLGRQWVRTLKHRDEMQNPAFIAEALTNFENDVRPLTDDEREKFNDPKEQPRLMKNIWARNVVGTPNPELIEILEKKGVEIRKILSPKWSFIIGSYPILIVHVTQSEGTDIRDTNVGVLLPISHDVIVTAAFSHGEERFVEIDEMLEIRQINKAIFNQSDMIAGRSRELIESLAGVRKKSV
ncbi:MAG: DUF4238 domain-containing protein [Nitrospinae bacterium]|nr:DUF4238 domain-containing protein [Nitrospinota bacterium]